jgi:hypothetical protein
MTPLFSPDESSLLTAEEFSAAFRSCWSRLSQRFFKFEALQIYAQPDEPSYRAFQDGYFLKAVRLIDEQVRRDSGFYEQARERSIQVLRLRLVRQPLTQYTKLELLSYIASMSMGADVRIVGAEFRGADDTSDFILFDDKAVLINNYDEGLPDGGWLVEEPETVSRFFDFAEQCLTVAVPLDDWRAEF